MDISQQGLELIESFEGFRENAYLDSGNLPTIGFGTIVYPNGSKVKMGDKCTLVEAANWLYLDVQHFVDGINKLTWDKPLNQAQFDSIVSFTYNVGLGALKGSTLYKLASVNPDDEKIYNYDKNNPANTCAFTMWIKAGGKVVQGLLNRRMKEADYYAGVD